MTAPDRLINLSGGCDSTLALYRELKAGNRPLVHYCHLVNSARRATHEERAVRGLCNWLWDNDYQFQIVRTAFYQNYNGNSRGLRHQKTVDYLLPDIYNVYYMALSALRKHRTIDKIVVSVIANDKRLRTYAGRARLRRAMVELLMPHREFEWLEPLKDLDKRQVIEALPPELFGLCFYCRRPAGAGTPEACWQRKPSGWCRPCRQVHAALKELGRL